MPGIPVIAMDVKHRDFTKNVRKYGYIFDKREDAEEYINWHNGWINLIADRTEGLSEDEKPLVLSSFYWIHPPVTTMYISGRNTPDGMLIPLTGGRNIGEELVPQWPVVDLEWIVYRNPDIIILGLSLEYSGYDVDDISGVVAVREEFMNLPVFAEVKAVQRGDVYTIPSQHWMVGGASCLLPAVYFAKWFQPDLFEDLDPQAIHQEWLTRFQRIDFDVKEHGVFVYHPEKYPDGR